MKNFKALVLASLILVPILVFAFGLIFGKQHFKLKTYFPELSETGEVMYTATGDTIFERVPNFKAVNQQGKVVTQEDLTANGVYVVHFFYTSCPSNCQQVTSQLMRVQEIFRNQADVKIASFTTNTTHDTQQVLNDYAAKYNASPNQWLFLSDSSQALFRLASENFYLPVTQDSSGAFFSDKLILVDKANRVRGIYDGTSTTETDRLVLEINVLLDDYSKRK